jgi:hypothetical protein
MLFLIVAGCDGGDSGSTGTINLSLTDASTTDYQAVYITVKRVEVQKAGGEGWTVISTPEKTYNLLDLVNGVREELALASLPSGHYTQMRLILSDIPDGSLNIRSTRHPYSNYFINNINESVELKIPSSYQTGIKIVQGFDINANETTELVLDFDATRSIVQAGSSGQWLLKPTIKMFETKNSCIISGNAGQPGVLVSAQVYNASTSVPIDERVQIEAASVSDPDGNYKLFVAPGSYTLVGYKDGYSPFYSSSKIITVAGNTYSENLSLASVSTGTLAGGISIPGSNPELNATGSIRQDVTIGGNPEQIQLKLLNIANGGTFSSTLPVGSFKLVVSTAGYDAIENQVSINSGLISDIGNIAF